MHSRRPQQRAALLGAIALSAALVVAGGAGWFQARAASVRIVQASAAQLRAGVSAELRGAPPTNASLVEVLATWEEVGLRSVLWSDERGEASAGDPAEVNELRSRLASAPPGRPRGDGGALARVGDRVYVVAPARGPRGRGGRERPRPSRGALAFSFEPLEALALESSASLTLGVGAGSALLLVLLAALLGRQWLAADRLDKEREAERHLAMLGTMSAVLGHQIKNPLASLKGNAQLLARKLSDEALVRKADRVVSEAVRLETLTDRILSFARNEPLQRAPTDLRALCLALLDRLEDPAVTLSIDEGLPAASIDAQWVEQAVENLLRNAREAAGPEGAVALRVEQAGDVVVIEVQDDGPGIPAALRKRVLEPFHTDKVQGTGLGLAVVSQVAHKHGGDVQIDDAPGGGARIRMTLRS